MYFLHRLMENKSSLSLLMSLIAFIPKRNLHMNLNKIHSDAKYTYETSTCTVNFLDLNANLKNGAIHTDL